MLTFWFDYYAHVRLSVPSGFVIELFPYDVFQTVNIFLFLNWNLAFINTQVENNKIFYWLLRSIDTNKQKKRTNNHQHDQRSWMFLILLKSNGWTCYCFSPTANHPHKDNSDKYHHWRISSIEKSTDLLHKCSSLTQVCLLFSTMHFSNCWLYTISLRNLFRSMEASDKHMRHDICISAVIYDNKCT